MNMKQPTSGFSFKKNSDVSALPHAVPEEPKTSAPKPKKPKAKVGRKPAADVGVRQKQVSAYLAESEWQELEAKLDGRPASTVLRKLILDYMKS
jgi:hypothetical protein